MRVLITGHRGYIGSVLSRVLSNHRFEVYGVDPNNGEMHGFGRIVEHVAEFACPFEALRAADLASFDAIVHLAPSEADPFSAFVRRAIESQCTRLVLVSSCAIYRRTGNHTADEGWAHAAGAGGSRLVQSQELALRGLAGNNFSPTVLRVPELYGVSPRLRLDLLVNDLVATAYTTGGLHVARGGAGWRSLVHVDDLCRIIAASLIAPREDVHDNVFNVVGESLRVIDIADAIAEALGCRRTVDNSWYDIDSRRIDGSKLQQTFPAFRFHWNLQRGIRQLTHALACNGVTAADHRGGRFGRMGRGAIAPLNGPPSSPPKRNYEVA